MDATDPAKLDVGALTDVAQWHLAGDRDETVPPEVVASFVRERAPNRLEIVPRMGHGGWAEGWAERIAALRRGEP